MERKGLRERTVLIIDYGKGKGRGRKGTHYYII